MMSETGKFTIGNVHKTYTDRFPNNLPTFQTANPHEPSQAPFKKLFEFPITALVHSTHTEEKRSICKGQDGKARFNANTYASQQMSLPGRYVWFSMKPTLPKEDPEFKEEDYNVYYVNDTSFYGTWSFTFDYKQLISAYKEHIENHSDPKKRDATVVLRNGGTQKYQREICYVVIVTHSKDVMHDNQRYPILQQYDDVLTTPYCTFHPKCIPPPFPAPPRWAGYDFKQLKYYDHIAFAINCDWRGEVKICSKADSVEDPTPVFKIPLPRGEPHCYFEDCKDDTEKAYCDFHPICLKYGNSQAKGMPACYLNERTQWLETEMPKKMKETVNSMKAAANEIEAMILCMDDTTEMSTEDFAAMTGKATEIAGMAKTMSTMVKNTTMMEDENTKDLHKAREQIEDMTKSAQVAMKAKEMGKMADDIAAMSGHTDDSDDELAKKVKELAQQNIKEAIQKITELPGVANQIADQIEKLVGPTDDDDQLAEMAEKSAQQKVKVATQKITELPWNANQIHVADKIEKRAERAKKRKNTEITHKKVTRKKQKCQADEDKENYNY